jgi:hypothetical protein
VTLRWCIVWSLLWAAGCAPIEGASVGELAGDCASCHAVQAEEHQLSKHAMAEDSKLFEALRERANTPFCDSCHRKITCIDCHAAVGNESVKNGLMIFDRDGPVRGPSGDAPSAPHATARSEYLLSSDLCGTCHEVAGPAGFSESPFTHWRSSPAASRNLTCRECHVTHRRGVPFGEGVRLSFRGEALVIDHSEGGHHFPDGASFLRDVAIVGRSDGAAVERMALGAELFSNGAPVLLPTDADEVVLRAVPAGESRIAFERAKPGTFCIEVGIRADVLAELRLERSEAEEAKRSGARPSGAVEGLEPPEEVQSFGCVSAP